MDRRLFTLSLCSLAFGAFAWAETQPWSAHIENGGYDGTDYWLGLAISLAPRWKTYWRVPGDGGVPPHIDVTGDNVARVEALYPLPTRFRDEAGETIGYKDKVVFPVRVTPVDAKAPMKLSVSAFFGVCDVVCIPANIRADLSLFPDASSTPGSRLLREWLDKVPVKTETGPVTAARAWAERDTVFVEFDLAQTIDDMFVEGLSRHYFGAPVVSGNRATIRVAGARTAEEVRQQTLNVVISAAGQGHEQQLRVL